MKLHHAPRKQPGLRGFAFARDDESASLQPGGVVISGWVLGESAPVREIRLSSGGVEIARMPVNQARKDIPRLHPDQEWAGSCGFRGALPLQRLPARFRLDVGVVLADESRRTLGLIEGSWTPPASIAPDTLAPLMVTTLGRSGSTWTMRLLGQHPEVTSYAPFRYEPRAASYWMGVYDTLSSPESVAQALRGELDGVDWWTGCRRRNVPVPAPGMMEAWLTSDHVQSMLPLALARIEAFYRESAQREEKELARVRVYTEKFTTNSWVQSFLTSLDPRAREIILVRDPRDMVCSMLAYNRRRGVSGFGRGAVDSDEEFARWWRHGIRQMMDELKAREGTALLLRYEDLVQRPEDTLAWLFEKVDLDASAATVKGILERARAMAPEAQAQHRTSKDVAASVGRWQTDLEPSVRDAAEEAFADLLPALGYDAAVAAV
jgi:hypothetical protein